MRKERNYGLDAARALATVFVVAEHFFMNARFYDAPLQGVSMALAALLRMMFMVCVPVFLMLSGWLCIDRQWNRHYLRGLLPILAIWVMCSALCLIFRSLWVPVRFGIVDILRGIFNYSAAPYGWYVEMYIGLYLLMPLINAGWRGLDDKGRTAITISLVAITSLPTITTYGVYQLLPRWWVNFYPVEYYVLGAWLRDHRPRCGGVWLLLGWIGCAAVAVAVRWFNAGGETFGWSEYTQTYGFCTAMGAVCLLCLLARCTGAHVPGPFRKLVQRVAGLSLPIYLLSYIFDELFYPPLNRTGLTMPQKLPYLPLMTLAVLVCTCLLSQLADWGAKGLLKLVPPPKKQNGGTVDEH